MYASTVEPLISPRSRDSISTVFCHSIPFERPNEQGGATVEIESRDRGDMREPPVVSSFLIFAALRIHNVFSSFPPC